MRLLVVIGNQINYKLIMDDKKNTGSPDSKRINIHENYEVEYWTKEFGVTAEKLKQAVAAVGTSAEAVREYLKK